MFKELLLIHLATVFKRLQKSFFLHLLVRALPATLPVFQFSGHHSWLISRCFDVTVKSLVRTDNTFYSLHLRDSASA